MSNIKSAFMNGKALVPFITCGDPDLETTGKVIRAAAENGADMIELGIPFSDPTAEGPVIQEANIRALAGGVTTDKIFDFLRELRRDVKIPIVFMTYANVIFSYGAEKFMTLCKETDVSGIIVPDLPFEEKDEFLPVCKEYDVDLISVVAPAPAERIAEIAKNADGFLYIISGCDEAWAEKGILTDLAEIVSVIRSNTDIPCIIDSGIPEEQQLVEFAKMSDGAASCSAVMKLLEENGKNADVFVGEYVKRIKSIL